MAWTRRLSLRKASDVDAPHPAEVADDVQDTPPISAAMRKEIEAEVNRLVAERARLAQYAVELPEEHFETPISTLKVGQHAFAVPWAIEVDSDGLCWIDANYPLDKESGGTACMRLTRTEHGFDASFAYYYDYKWNRGKVPLTGNFLPVTSFDDWN